MQKNTGTGRFSRRRRVSLLEVKNLSVGFREGKKVLPVIDGVSFSVDRGGILALVGESGCGKSASCLALTRLKCELPPEFAAAEQVLARREPDWQRIADLCAANDFNSLLKEIPATPTPPSREDELF